MENKQKTIEHKVGSPLVNMGPIKLRQPIPVEVVAVTEGTVTFDANPPLAGEELIFEVEMVGILKAD